MSRKIYWSIVANRSWGKSPKIWPWQFYSTHGDAHLDAMRRNNWEKKHKFPRKWHVKRFQLEYKSGVNYDVYEHEFKRINK